MNSIIKMNHDLSAHNKYLHYYSHLALFTNSTYLLIMLMLLKNLNLNLLFPFTVAATVK